MSTFLFISNILSLFSFTVIKYCFIMVNAVHCIHLKEVLIKCNNKHFLFYLGCTLLFYETARIPGLQLVV